MAQTGCPSLAARKQDLAELLGKALEHFALPATLAVEDRRQQTEKVRLGPLVVAGHALDGADLLAVYTRLAEEIDPDFSRPTPWPPWWWYF
jgi:hypothetical protein